MDMNVAILDPACDCGCPYTAHDDGRACLKCRMCLGWVLPAAERDALRDRELEEMVDFGGAKARLDTGESALLLDMLIGFEAMVAEDGWDQPPTLFSLVQHRDPFGQMGAIALAEIPVPPVAWQAGIEAGRVVEMFSEVLRDHGNGAVYSALKNRITALGGRFVGVAMACEAYIRREDAPPDVSVNRHPEYRQDEVRMIHGVDIDERQYSVTRSRSDNHVHTEVITTARMNREIAALAGPLGDAVRASPNATPRVVRALGAMVRTLRDLP